MNKNKISTQKIYIRSLLCAKLKFEKKIKIAEMFYEARLHTMCM